MKKLLVSILAFITTVCNAQKPTLIIPDGHGFVIGNIILDKQEKYIYTAETNKCIMWEAKTGRQLYTFPLDHGGSIDFYIGMDISPDGNKIAIASGGVLNFYNTKTGKKITGGERSRDVTDLKFSADGKYIYMIRGNGIHILDAGTLAEKEAIKDDFDGYSGRIWLLADNKVLVVGDSYPTTSFKVYDIDTKQKISSFDFPKGNYFRCYFFFPKQNLLAASGSSGLVFYDIFTNTIKGSIAYKGDLSYAAIIPSQNTDEILISGESVVEGEVSSSNLLNLYSTVSFKKINTFFNNTTVDEENHRTIGGYFNGFKKELWAQIEGEKVGNFNLTSKKYTVFLDGIIAEMSTTFYTMIYNNVNGYLHITTDKENFKTIDLTRMKSLSHKDLKTFPDAVATTFTGDTIAVFNNNTVTVKNIVTGKIIKRFTGLGRAEGISLYPNNFFFSNDNNYLFYCDDNTTTTINKGAINIIRMNLITGIKQKFINAKGFGFTTVHPDKTIMAGFESGYQFNTAVVWDLVTGKRIFSKEVKSSFIQISFDKKKIILGDGKLYNIYDIQTQQITSSITIPDDNSFKALAINKDFSLLARGLLGGNISMYDAKKGKELYSIHAHISDIDKIFFSPDEKLFYSIGSYDNSIKAWETATGRLIGTLYLFRGSTDYVFMDADGRFDGTPEGVKQIYYVINQKPMPLDKIFEKYYTPNLYARSVAGEKFDKIDVIIKPFPKAKISYAEAKRNLEVEEDGIPVYKNTTGFADITVNASAEDDAIDEIRLFQNGKIVTLTSRNLIVTNDADKTDFKKYKVALLPGVNSLRAVALNTQRSESDPDEITVNYKTTENNTPPIINKPININDKPIDLIDKKATLHLIVVGINQYQNKKMSLNYALADATSFKDELEKDVKSVIGNVKTYFVTDDAASKKGITEAFAAVQQNAKPQDVFIFYYAGHGVIGKDKEFYLVPTDVSNLADVQTELEQKGIPSKLLQQYAIDIQAQKQLFILDACQSAGAFETLISNDGNQQKSLAVVARSTGTHWMAASGAKQYANEFASLGHGVFTYILLQALKGEAANNKQVTVNGLKNFLQIQVPALMKKYNGVEQYPASYGFGNDFPVEVLK